MSKLITISGVDNLPTPSDYQPDIEILENSTRNAVGTLLREIIAYKTKLNYKWNYMTLLQKPSSFHYYILQNPKLYLL